MEYNMKDVVTVSELQKWLNISRPTIYKMIKEGRIEAINSGGKHFILTESLKIKTPVFIQGEQQRS